jgi:hypothetical protein
MAENKDKFDSNNNLEIETNKEKLKGKEKLIKFAKELSNSLIVEGFPLVIPKEDNIEDYYRIDINKFSDVYPEEDIKKDIEKTNEKELNFKEKNEKIQKQKTESLSYKTSPDKIIEKELGKENISQGILFEIFKTSLFNKFLKEDFLVLRTSRYDDIKNGVDNLILEKNEKNVICAIDDVTQIKLSSYFEEKKKEILRKNLELNGVKIKYGVYFEKDKNGQRVLRKGPLENIPLFYLPLTQDYLKKGLNNFIPSLSGYSDYEKKLMKYFLEAFMLQIRMLELESYKNDDFLKKISIVKKTVRRWDDKIKSINAK